MPNWNGHPPNFREVFFWEQSSNVEVGTLASLRAAGYLPGEMWTQMPRPSGAGAAGRRYFGRGAMLCVVMMVNSNNLKMQVTLHRS